MKQKIITAACQFALKCSNEGMVKWNLYKACAEACGAEYDQHHNDWMLKGSTEYDEIPNIKWEKTVQSVLEQA